MIDLLTTNHSIGGSIMDPPIEDLFRISLRLSTYILKSCGNRMPPWQTPLVTLKLSEMQVPHLTVISCF